MSIKLEPQDCIDPECTGEITWDETDKQYVCMSCHKPACGDTDPGDSVDRSKCGGDVVILDEYY